MPELSESALATMAGWDAVKEARSMVAGGRVSEPSLENGVLKARISAGGKQFTAGLKWNSPRDVDNLCPCRDSRVRGVICAHSVAAGLAWLKPAPKMAPGTPAARPTTTATASRLETTEQPEVEITLEGSLRHIDAVVAFRYKQDGIANPTFEQSVSDGLMKAGFRPGQETLSLSGEDAVAALFADHFPALKTLGKIKTGERLSKLSQNLSVATPSVRLEEKSDGWLDFSVHFTAGKEAVFSYADIQQLLRKGSRRLQLANGRTVAIPSSIVEDMEEVLRDCDPTQERQTYRIRAMQRGYIAESIATWTGRDGDNKEERSPELGSLEDRLRPYQQDGAKWLLRLAKQNQGGLLADDMGLGKTIQTIAMLECLPGPHLIVCPASLVWNWKAETERFAPHLRCLVLHGPDRAPLFPEIPEHSLVLTSYAVLQRDIALFQGHQFTAVVLDEAQHIKNPGSKNAAAARVLRSSCRFILTGTPIENSVRDLWSLFDFILPGYLGSHADFRDRYEKPITEDGRGAAWSRLARRVRPWMLRRTKRDVLADLPERIEQTVEVDLSPDQKAAYTQLQIAARAGLDELKRNSAGARMQVLTALLRLRQASCDLRLLGLEASAPSGKLEALVELMRQALDGGHRVLVFSQFTSMLDLIGAAFDEAGITYCRLDGSTHDRQSVVTRFQTDASVASFLISLKSGGVGLNLTAADTVIHFDPWWNPAVERQATDRAHRIGQTRIVTALKLIARDTVESRVLALQARKSALLDGIFDEDSVAALDPDEIAALIG